MGHNFESTTSNDPLEIASLWLRFRAAFIDGFLVALTALGAGSALGIDVRDPNFAQGLLVLHFLYHAIFESRIGRGQTLGKRVARIRVVNQAGEHLSVPNSVIRSATQWLLALFLPVWFIPDFSAVVFNRRKRRTLHDLAAGSLVVQVGTAPAGGGKILLVPIGIFALIALSVAVPRFLQMPAAPSGSPAETPAGQIKASLQEQGSLAPAEAVSVEETAAETAEVLAVDAPPASRIQATPSEVADRGSAARLQNSVFELVVAKLEDAFIVWDRPIPVDKIPFMERNEKFIPRGTAFAIGPNRFVSSAHVFQFPVKSLSGEVFLRDASSKTHKIKSVLTYSNYRDLIEFDLVTLPDPVVPLILNDQPKVGENVYTVGNAQGEGISYRGGQIASFSPEPNEGKWKYIRFSAPTSPGNSGGPLIDASDRVVGIVTARNSTENLNFAVPVSELTGLSSSQAEFYEPRVRLEIDAKSVERNWRYAVPLPATVATLTNEALRSVGQIYEELTDELYKSDPRIAPYRASFQEFTRHQEPETGFGHLGADPSADHWSVIFPRLEVVPLGSDREMRVKMIQSNILAIIEKPSDVSLLEFVMSPKLIMHSFLQMKILARQFGGERLVATSLGEPAKNWKWKDRAGRAWQSSHWLLPSLDTVISQDCLPVPEGVACVFSRSGGAAATDFSIRFRLKQYERLLVSYEGRLEQWEEFMQLGPEHLPPFLHKLSIRRTPKKQLKVSLADVSAKLPLKTWYLGGMIHLLMGYTPGVSTFAMEPLQLAMDPEGRGAKGFTVGRVFAPMDISPRKYVWRWTNLTARDGKFNGQPFVMDGTQRIQYLMNHSENQRGFEERFVISCSDDIKVPVGGFKSRCNAFQAGIEFGNAPSVVSRAPKTKRKLTSKTKPGPLRKLARLKPLKVKAFPKKK